MIGINLVILWIVRTRPPINRWDGGAWPFGPSADWGMMSQPILAAVWVDPTRAG